MTTETKEAAVEFLLAATRATKVLQIWVHCAATGDVSANDLHDEFERQHQAALERAVVLKHCMRLDEQAASVPALNREGEW